jgi:hypothetical protein
MAFACGSLRWVSSKSSAVQCKLNFHAPLCFDFSTTSEWVLAGGRLPESCPKNGDLPKSPLLSTGSADAIGKHNSNSKKLILACIVDATASAYGQRARLYVPRTK